jgi:hypothetical protein
VIQADARDVVVSELNAKRILNGAAGPLRQAPVTEPEAAHEAMVGLKLIAVDRIVQGRR